eukprot:364270-Chlamydomonas_euryale.AAC.4
MRCPSNGDAGRSPASANEGSQRCCGCAAACGNVRATRHHELQQAFLQLHIRPAGQPKAAPVCLHYNHLNCCTFDRVVPALLHHACADLKDA